MFLILRRARNDLILVFLRTYQIIRNNGMITRPPRTGSRKRGGNVGRIMLRDMEKGQSGTITAIKVAGDLGRRVREMGLVPGTTIKIQGRAPLYDPVALRVMGGTLTLRNNEADFIEVEVEDPAAG